MSYFVGHKAVKDGHKEDGGFAINGDYVAAATKAAGELYGYGRSNVLFKPTKAVEAQFRPGVVNTGFCGGVWDKRLGNGFAINGGKGWADVVFDNHFINVIGEVAIAMGNYFFTSAADGSKTKVEYTFGYAKNSDGKVRIFLHHSSVPYSPGPPAISQAEVQGAQAAWASAIKSISRTYLDGGDYVGAA
ncbi:abcG22, partial [Symbiodinium pilosum]